MSGSRGGGNTEVGLHLDGNGKSGGVVLDNENVHSKRQNTVVQYISTRLLMDLYKGVERNQGAQLGM